MDLLWCPYCKEYIVPDKDDDFCPDCSSPLQNNKQIIDENAELRVELSLAKEVLKLIIGSPDLEGAKVLAKEFFE